MKDKYLIDGRSASIILNQSGGGLEMKRRVPGVLQIMRVRLVELN